MFYISKIKAKKIEDKKKNKSLKERLVKAFLPINFLMYKFKEAADKIKS